MGRLRIALRQDGKAFWRHDIVMAVLGIASVALVFWFEDADLNARQTQLVLLIDLLVVLVFITDWILSMREAPHRGRYVWGNWWKLLGMIPLVISTLAFFRLLRLARVVYVMDLIPPVHRFFLRLRDVAKSGDLVALAAVAIFITLGGAVLVWLAERHTNPRLAELSEAVWWAVVTVTTVGYGDITPVTRLGRFVAVLLMVTGIGTIGLLASQVSTALIKGEKEQQAAEAHPHTLPGQLAHLVRMHEDGHLDDDEFESAKAKVLSK